MSDEVIDAEFAEVGEQKGELVVHPHTTQQTMSLFGSDDPAEVVARASATATALADVVNTRNLFKTISGKKHVLVEGWTLLGSMLGVFPVMESCDPVELNGIKGYKATVAAQTRDGSVIGRATAFCMRNENRWKTADEYAVASMAQCVPLRAEILTRGGFKNLAEIKVGDEVLGYDCERKNTRWVSLEAVNVFGPSEVVRMRSRSFDVTCTPDHTWVVKANADRAGRKLVKTRDLGGGRQIVLASLCPQGEEIGHFAAVAGWLLTDGTIRQPARGTTRMHIDQSKYVAEVRAALDAAGLDYSEKATNPPPRRFPGGNVSVLQRSHRFALSAESARKLIALGLESKSDGPAFAAKLGPVARAAMLNAMLLADGSQRDGRRWRFGKTNPSVMETFQILATLNGRALGKLTGFTMVNGNWMPMQTLRQNTVVHTASLKIEALEPEAVWCPTTPLGTWVMRLDGMVAITGNTRATSKCLRAPLGFVMTLAGYEATPEAEIPQGDETARPAAKPAASAPTLSAETRARLDAGIIKLDGKPGWDIPAVIATAAQTFKRPITQVGELTEKEALQIIDAMKQYGGIDA